LADAAATRAAILVVDQQDQRPDVAALLERRFGADYEIVREETGLAALERLRAMQASGIDVALILADQWTSDMTGVELLRASIDAYPDARRGVLVGPGELPRAREEILQAAALGEIETYVIRPLIELDEVFYRDISRYIQEWDHDHRPQAVAVRLIGDELDDELRRLYEGLIRSGVATAFHRSDSDEGRAALAAAGVDGKRPVAIVFDGKVIQDPTGSEVAAAIGANDDPGAREFDLVIVGAGPAGLAAAVYGTSEGLRCMVVEEDALGGQASTSSMIRNYLGFPRGLTGSDLATRAYWQAWFFGTHFQFGRRVEGIRIDGTDRVLTFDNGDEIRARAVVLACGVSYRRIGIAKLEQLVGRGCFYGSPVTEAPGVAGHQVVVVGGGNSSAQTALYLSRFAAKVTLVARRAQLDEMSYYLVRDLAANNKVEIRLNTEVVDAKGRHRLRALVLRDAARNIDEEIEASAVFILIGAEPRIEWLPESIERDERGYVLTGNDVAAATVDGERRALPFETSMAGVFAAGDLRLGGMKRVAAAVGDGSSVLRHVHEFLALQNQAAAAAHS
jgi:thioredoxin reductase (NADPH)